MINLSATKKMRRIPRKTTSRRTKTRVTEHVAAAWEAEKAARATESHSAAPRTS